MGAIIFFAVVFAVGVVAIIIAEQKRKKRARCLRCKEKYDYEHDVSWQVVRQIEENDKIKEVVEIQCVCHKCGAVKKFTRTFTTAERNKNTGVITRYDIYDKLQKEFR